ncbi:hypothetical protein F5Y19DRAFT_276714 [Xylariaceae sp. FL1651]|nr:hypothetical protein F5Y19DRAFT_276714 [Xylariaceae sp. FL1651]
MDSTVSHKEVWERRHRRASSRGSTASTTHTQMTTKSTSTSSSHPRATTPSNTSHTHRYHHSQCDKGMVAMRPLPRLSRESSRESKQTTAPVSSLLQQRLERERRAEGERLASQFGGELSSSTGDFWNGDVQSSPDKRYTSIVERRPKSSQGDDASSQSSMGAKQVEKAVSTLHKQNFDLKLELFHRREKQATLEARVEKLESEQRELTDIQENLLVELEKRDKAIEEAVNMIVKLEARVDELVREKEIVRRVEADGSYRHSRPSTSESCNTATPKIDDDGVLQLTSPKTLERMPSFLSERSTHTENLRNIVLQGRNSLMHMRKVSEVSASSAEVSEVNRIASPSLSMLSESSFVSIYGSKDGQDTCSLPPLEDVVGMDGALVDRSLTPTKRKVMTSCSPQKIANPNRLPNMMPRAGASLSGQLLPLKNTLNNGSPPQKLEKPGEQKGSTHDISRLSTTSRRRAVITPTPRSAGSPPKASKQENSETLQKVLTSYPTHKELANSHTLPPTPDTVSSSVLRKHKNLSSSQDSLPGPEDALTARFLAAPLPESTAHLESTGSRGARPALNAHLASTTAFSDRRDLPGRNYTELDADLFSDFSKLARSIPPRPRSAAETTISRPRTDSLVSDSDSDSDSDGGADAHSDVESHDYWMRESYKPNKHNGGSSTRRERRRAPSPDLFSFPVNSGGWEPDAMFGALKGSGFLGPPVAALKRDPIDEMASALQTPQPGPLEPAAGVPQPPSRRSSLNVHAASHLLLSSLNGRPKKSPSRESSVMRVNARGRSNSVDCTGHMPLPQIQTDVGSPTKRSQYPPISGLQSRGRGLGLNLFFRRPGSESRSTPPSAPESTSSLASHQAPLAQQIHLRHLTRPSGRSSVPPPATMPWATRPIKVFEDDYHSATPPPIMRNRPQPLQGDLASLDTTNSAASQAAEAEIVPASPTTAPGATAGVVQIAPGASQSGGKRKWLGLGRMGSLKNRTAS